MTVYIAGPMTGIEDNNRKAFEEAEEKLLALGHKVLNPIKISETDDRGLYLLIKRTMIDDADAIYLLEGWEDGKDTLFEIECVIDKGKKKGMKIMMDYARED